MNSVTPTNQPIDAALKQAIEYHKLGRLQEAAQLYSVILQTKPNQPEANHQLGLLLCEAGQHANALRYLKAALTASPSNLPYALPYAEALVTSGHLEEAQKVLKNAQKRGLDSVAAQHLQKKIKVATQGRQRPAVAPQIDINQLIALFNSGRFVELESKARALLENDQNSGLAWKILGAALQMQGKDSLHALEMAAQLLPDDAEAHSNLGAVLRELGQQDGATTSYRRALQINPDYAEAHNNLGISLQETGQLEDAVASYRRAIQIKPGYAEPNNNLGTALRELGRLDDAVASYRRALQINPNFAQAHNNLGVALLDLGQLDAAAASYRLALQIKPDYAEAHYNFGNVLRRFGQLGEAAESYRRAVEFNPAYIDAYTNLSVVLRHLGKFDDAADILLHAQQATSIRAEELQVGLAMVYRDQGRITEAEAICRKALTIKPDLVCAITFMAALASDKGLFTEAEDWYRRAILIDPESSAAWGGIALLRKMTLDDTPWLSEAQRIAEKNLAPPDEAYLRYSIGKYFDDVNDADQAFASYRRANELARSQEAKYDRAQQEQTVAVIARLYDRNWVCRKRENASPSARPVMIVGMPRSGTSLTEQIVASHPSAFGAGELPFWSSFAASDESSAFNAAVSDIVLEKVANDYLQLLESFSSDALRVVDKMPGNFMLVGLIHAAFPNARIIHMQRNPLDTCLSAYFQPFESGHPYTYDLEDLAHYYSQYLRIMQHWRTALPEGAMLEVPYESLVDDQEGWSRKILEFIDLPWDPRCLDFHKTVRTVSTVSKWQVRQKIGKSSVERWRKYEKFVGPLQPLLQATHS